MSDRARPLVLALSLVWLAAFPFALRMWWISGFDHGAIRGQLLLQAIAGLVVAAPIGAVLVLSWLRPDVTRRVYWFLPAYFAASGLASVIAHAGSFDQGVGASDAVAGIVRAAPSLLLALGLWICRPKPAFATEVSTSV